MADEMKVHKVTLEIVLSPELEKGIKRTEDNRLLVMTEVVGQMNIGLGTPGQAKVTGEVDLHRVLRAMLNQLFVAALIRITNEEMTLDEALKDDDPDEDSGRVLDGRGGDESVPRSGQ